MTKAISVSMSRIVRAISPSPSRTWKTCHDLIVTLALEAHHKALELTLTMAADVEYWPTIEPSATAGNREQILQSYRAVRDQLFERIKVRFGLTGTPQA